MHSHMHTHTHTHISYTHTHKHMHKHTQLPYTEIGFTASGEVPQKEPGVFYSDDVQNV